MAIGIGILGCGMITQVRHAPEYARDPRAKITLVWDADPTRAREMADRYGAEVAATPEALWTSPLVDAVSVCTPNHLHGPQTVAALGAGKHVLCEKPMASSLDEARAHYGVLGDLGTHKIDLIRYLTGQDVASVQGWVGTVHKAKADDTPIDLEDEALVRMRMASGLVGTLDVSWCHYGSADNETVVNGEKGVLTLRPEGAGELILETSDGRTVRHSFGGGWGLPEPGSGVIRGFLDALETHRPPLVTGKDGWAALEVVEATLESSRSGGWKEVGRVG